MSGSLPAAQVIIGHVGHLAAAILERRRERCSFASLRARSTRRCVSAVIRSVTRWSFLSFLAPCAVTMVSPARPRLNALEATSVYSDRVSRTSRFQLWIALLGRCSLAAYSSCRSRVAPNPLKSSSSSPYFSPLAGGLSPEGEPPFPPKLALETKGRPPRKQPPAYWPSDIAVERQGFPIPLMERVALISGPVTMPVGSLRQVGQQVKGWVGGGSSAAGRHGGMVPTPPAREQYPAPAPRPSRATLTPPGHQWA